MTSTSRLLTAVLTVLMLVLAGCGVDDGTEDAETSTEDTEETTTTEPEVNEEPDEGDGGEEEPGGSNEEDDPTEPTDEDGDDDPTTPSTTEAAPGPEAEAFCGAFESVDDLNSQLSDALDAEDLAAFQQAYPQYVTALEDTLDVAPPELRRDVENVVNAIGSLSDEVAAAQTAADIDALEDNRAFSDNEASFGAVNDYTNDNCGS